MMKGEMSYFYPQIKALMCKMIEKAFPVVMIVIMIMTSSLHAQFGAYGLTDARSNALGNSHNASSYTLFSLGSNPSLLAANSFNRHTVQVLFPSATLQSYSISTLDDFLSIFSSRPPELLRSLTGKKLLEAYRSIGQVSLQGVINFVSIGYQPSPKVGYFAFHTSEFITSSLKLPSVLIDFGKKGKIDGSASLNDFEFNSWWLRNYSISYARAIETGWENGLDRIWLGASMKYIQGFMYTEMAVRSSLALGTEDNLLEGSYRMGIRYSFSENLMSGSLFDSNRAVFRYPNLSPSGKGFGVNIGASFHFSKGVVVGVSVTDLGSISWEKNSRNSILQGGIRIDRDVTLDELKNLFDSIYVAQDDISEFTTPLATVFRFGLVFSVEEMVKHFPGKLQVALDINQALTDAPGNYDPPRFSLGAEYHPKPRLPIVLTGFSYDQYNNFRWGFGLGYKVRFMDFYLSTLDMLSFFNDEARTSVSFSILWTILQ